MEQVFNISYLALWIIVTLQTYYIVQIGKKRNIQQANTNQGPVLVHEHHGVPAGELFPQLQFDSINQGSIDLKSMTKTGFLIAFTSVSCDQCKLVYPILKRFYQLRPDIEIILMMQGNDFDVEKIINQFQLTMPIVPIIPSDMARLQTGYYPFIYYLSSAAEVRTKSIINFEEQLNLLVEKGQMKVAA
ncbi:hypothetical protein ABN764_00840 [Paenibacillaceae sp. P-4]|uniref:hypothetical protein n=1 Tax=Paenibacillaceae bacterium P-4 TaxID=3160969 RepID=UPI0032E81979